MIQKYEQRGAGEPHRIDRRRHLYSTRCVLQQLLKVVSECFLPCCIAEAVCYRQQATPPAALAQEHSHVGFVGATALIDRFDNL